MIDAVGLALHDRDQVEQRLAGHDHAGRVHAPLPLEALEADRGVDHGLDVVVAVVEGAELAALGEAPVVGSKISLSGTSLPITDGGHRLGDAVAHREGVAEDAAGVLDGLLGLDGAVGDDLGDPVGAVLLGDVPDRLATPALVEVDVDVGHGDALGVEEPLEEQAVLEGVELGDARGVGDDRAGGRAAAGTDVDAVGLGPVDDVGGHQEVAREAHLGDDADLAVGTRLRLDRDGCRRSGARDRAAPP